MVERMVKEWTRGLERESTYRWGLRTAESGIKDEVGLGKFWEWPHGCAYHLSGG